MKKWLIENGLESKLKGNVEKASTNSFMWDKLVFNKTKAALGGNCRFAATGGAPISAEVLRFLKVVLCVPIQEGKKKKNFLN